MRIVISEFISLDGVVPAPGGPEEDTGRGCVHGVPGHGDELDEDGGEPVATS